ncbi:unnamed protein product [Parnassius apollo]|uniref:(apollo) hypothetical protein n=1 Tax=Parnassius apollo TaxID=110799 RepID=A0A8S3X7K9_PARAO|nr:unnamed protein product [Parnassius apollo]
MGSLEPIIRHTASAAPKELSPSRKGLKMEKSDNPPPHGCGNMDTVQSLSAVPPSYSQAEGGVGPSSPCSPQYSPYASPILQRKRPMKTDNGSKETKRFKFGAHINSSKLSSNNEGSDHNLDGVIGESTNLANECDIPSNSNLEEQETRKDKAVQTCNCLLRDRGFDQNLPFGVILIYNDFNSRTPSKILFSSLNAIVKKI